MNCSETSNLISGYMDGELDIVHTLEIERHLQSCPECEAYLKTQRGLQTVLRSRQLCHRAPLGLEANVLTAVRGAQTPTRRWPSLRLALAGAAYACLLLGGWALSARMTQGNASDGIAHEVVCSHVRSLMVTHLTDIATSDKKELKPWFSGKLDYAPPIVDLKAEGFPLLGGRLDYVSDRPVAALLYGERAHPINLFLWPVAPGDAPTPHEELRKGYHLYQWNASGLTYWAVSDLNPQVLQRFAQSLQTRISILNSSDKCD